MSTLVSIRSLRTEHLLSFRKRAVPSHQPAIPSTFLLNFDTLAPTEHGHISYVVIIVRVLED